MRDVRFHQGFALQRERLSGFVRCIEEHPAASDDDVGAFIGVNPYMVEGLRGWLYKTGLGRGNSRNYSLTPLGALVANQDSALQQLGTQWVLHYYLCSQHEERAEVWFRGFNDFLSPGRVFNTEELQTYIERTLEYSPSNTKGVASDTKELIKAYTQPSALGALGILAKRGKSLEVSTTRTPEPLIAAYILFDSWSRRFVGTDVVRLSQISSEPECIGRIFVATHDQVREIISTLQGLGLVNYADTQHEAVARRYHEAPMHLLERYYQER